MNKNRVFLDELAGKLDQFAFDYDTYNYMDAVETREVGFLQVRSDLIRGNTEGIKEFLSAVIEDGDSLDQLIADAKSLLKDLDAYENRGKLGIEEKNSILQQIETVKTLSSEKLQNHKTTEKEETR